MKFRTIIRFFILFFCCLFPIKLRAEAIVQLNGKQLPHLIGKPVDQMHLFSVSAKGEFNEIVLQIDEKVTVDHLRVWALDHYTYKRGQPNPPNGILEEDEVLLFRLEDAGEPLKIIPPHFANATELKLDAAGEKVVYLRLITEQREVNKKFVTYDAKSELVTTDQYQIGFDLKEPIIQNRLVLKNATKVGNILKRFKVSFKLDIKNFFDFSFDETTINSKVLGWREGPIRVIRRLEASKSLGPVRLVPKTVVEFVFYPSWVEIPSKIKNPVNGPGVLGESTAGYSGYLFNDQIKGSRLWTNLSTSQMTLGANPPQKLIGKISGPNFKRWGLTGDAGNMLVELTNDPRLAALNLYPKFTYTENATELSDDHFKKPETFIGFNLPYHLIPKGDYTIKVKLIFPKELTQENVQQAILTHRLSEPFQISLVEAK